MEMREEYRSYGSNTPLMIFMLIVTAAAYGSMQLVLKFAGDNKLRYLIAILIVYLALLIGMQIVLRIKSCFVADDTKVTFSGLLSKDITIYYMDIEAIAIYNERKKIRRRRFGSKSFYVETMIITTYDGDEFIFKNIMDIYPNSMLEASGKMDKLFEMGKFRVLKRFIEEKDFY